jgi:hypothetical protein
VPRLVYALIRLIIVNRAARRSGMWLIRWAVIRRLR